MSRHRARVRPGRARSGAAPWLLAGAVAVTALAALAPRPPAGPAAPAEIELSAGTSGSALFAAGSLVPGRPLTRCLAVRLRDAVPGSTVRLFAVIRSGGLGRYLAVTVRTGTGGATGGAGSCAGFVPSATPFQGRLSGLAAAERQSPGGLPVLRLQDSDGGATFQVTVSVIDTNAAQGQTARFDLVWSAPAAGPAKPDATRATPGAGQAATPSSVLHRLSELTTRLARTVGLPLVKASVVSAPVALLVVLFLMVQNWIDRRDPKLALAPVRPPEQLDFLDRSAVP